MRVKWTATLVVLAVCVASAAGQRNRATAVTATGEIHYFKNIGTVAIDSVTLDFFPANGRVLSDPKDKGNQIVRVNVTITNTSETPFRVAYTSLKLRPRDGTKVTVTSTINRGNSADRLASVQLAPGASVTGALYYEVPASETLDSLALVYEGYAGTAKTDYPIALGATPAGAPTPAAVPAAKAPAPVPAVKAPAPKPAPKPAAAPGAGLAAAKTKGLSGKWALDEAKSKAAPDGNTAGLMKEVTLNEDGTFTALYGTKGTWKFDGQTLSVFYSNSPGLEKKGGIATDGEWLKFPAPAGLNRFCYLTRVQ
jgi:hypothetical protein